MKLERNVIVFTEVFEMKLKPGDLLNDITSGITYAVVYVSTDYITICQQNNTASKIILFQQSVESVDEFIKNGYFTHESKEHSVVDVNALSDSNLKRYHRNLEIIKAFEKEYGPDYIGYVHKGEKPLLKELMNTYSLSRPGLLKIIGKYLRSGCQLSSLVERRSKPRNTNKGSGKIRGRKPESGPREAKKLDDNDYKNMQESLEFIRENKSHVATKKDAYIRMLNMHYTNNVINDDGSVSRQLLPIGQYPSIRQYYSFLNKNLSKHEFEMIRTSAREYRNDKRALHGTERGELTYPGELCDIDATPVDIYLVSKSDPTQLVNRGHMYFIIDVLTGMILAGNVSFEDNSNAAVTNVLINLKREGRDRLLRETGVTLDSDDYWPTDIKPGTLRCDRGSEFVSSEFRRKCKELGITIQLVPAATGSMKGTVEKEFNQFNLANSDFFEHKGLILKRYDSDHKKTACMDISDMRTIMVSYILYHNSRVIESRMRSPEMIDNNVSSSPVELWKFYSRLNAPHIITMDINQYTWALMKPARASKTRQGIKFKGLFYICNQDVNLGQFMMQYGPAVSMDIRYDESSMEHIFYVSDGRLYTARLNPAYTEQLGYASMSYDRFMSYRSKERAQLKNSRHANLKRHIEQNERLEAIASGKEASPQPEKTSRIKENTRREKEADNREHSISSLIEKEPIKPDADISTISEAKKEASEQNITDAAYDDEDLDRPIREEDPDAFREAFLKKYGYKK